MPTYELGDARVPVEFPYEAYECQLEYMEAVIRALDSNQNAMLESPTGTGKTLCLLCASLGWRRHREKFISETRLSWDVQADAAAAPHAGPPPKIWYSSRTHSQLKQVVKELKHTSYRPGTTVLGSRQHFCVHTSVSRHSGAKQTALCKRARDEKRCPFYTGFQRGNGKSVSSSCKDIEEIVSAFKECTVCPYYKSREDAKEAELLFLPYEYLINPQTRDSVQISLKNAILIFDEGHNIDKSCETTASFDLTHLDLAGSICEIDDACALLEQEIGGLEEAMGEITSEQMMAHLVLLKKHLLALEDGIYEEKLAQDSTSDRMMMKAGGSHILKIFAGGSAGEGVTKKDYQRVSNVIKKAVTILTFSHDSVQSGGMHLEKISSMLNAVFRSEPQDLDMNYRLLLHEDVPEEGKRGTKRKSADFMSSVGPVSNTGAKPRTLSLWCFSSSVVLQELQAQEVGSIIITSGTLSPIEGTISSFGIPFPVVLENGHVIDPQKQVWGGVIRAGPCGKNLNASYTHREEPAYLQDLGLSVARFASCVPDGLLLAFQSYAQKESILKAWKHTGTWDNIVKHKPLFEEPKGQQEMQRTMTDYTELIDRGPTPERPAGGAILAAVCRGKLCEGIDFTDRQCRMVLLVGIPYPSAFDLRVTVKMNFLDGIGAQGDGRKWYCREASRAVNQTLGRVIRHRNDFGAVALLDERYSSSGRLAPIGMEISGWLRPRVSVPDSFDNAFASCARFFSGHSETVVSPAARDPAPSVNTAPNAQAKTATGGGVPSPGAAAGQKQEESQARRGGTFFGNQSRSNVVSLKDFAERWKNASTQGSTVAKVSAAEAPSSQSGNEAIKTEERTAQSSDAPRHVPTPQTNAPIAQAPATQPRPAPAQAPAAQPRPAPTAQAPAAQPRPVGAAHSARVLAAQAAPASKTAESPSAKWLKTAADLVPAMDYEELRESLQSAVQAAEAISGNFVDLPGDVLEKFESNLANMAEIMLPEMSFDSPKEEATRQALIREVPSLFPKMLQPRWRKCVDANLQAQGAKSFLWS